MMKLLVGLLILILVIVVGLFALRAQNSETDQMIPALGVLEGKLTACPDKKNCVNSDDPQQKFLVDAISDPDGKVWTKLDEIMLSLPRTELIEEEPSYKRFTQTSAIFRFVDDIEFLYRPDLGEIAVRSASRVGHSDMGVNAARVEEIKLLIGEIQ